MVKFDVKVNIGDLAGRKKAQLKKAQYVLDNQVLSDSNQFIPYQDGDLHDSAFLASRLGDGDIRWSTPYARRRYYEPADISRAVNASAQTHWFEEAKSRYLQDWLGIVAKEVGGKIG